MAKLHALLSRQILQVEHVSALIADFEWGLKSEQRRHLATQEALNCAKYELGGTAEEIATLRTRVKIADDVLQAVRETREIDISDRFSLSSLVQDAVDRAELEFEDERKVQRREWHERQILLKWRSAALDARERALESNARSFSEPEISL